MAGINNEKADSAEMEVSSVGGNSRGRFEQFKLLIEYLSTKALFGAITAFITIVTGCLASFYSPEIRTSITQFFNWADTFNSAIFWLFFVATGLLLWGGLWGQGRKSKREADRLESMVNRLQALPEATAELKAMVDKLQELPGTTIELNKMVVRLQTLPTEGYLPSYASYYRIAAESAFPALIDLELPVSEIEATIRIVLGSAIMAAKDYDGAADDAIYSANIMLWRSGCAGLESSKPRRLIRFGYSDTDVEGVLELIPVLSTSSKSMSEGNWDFDVNAPALVLPIFQDLRPTPANDENGRYRIMPGAGWAFCKKKFFLYRDISEIMKLLDTKVSANPHEKAEIVDYFLAAEGALIKSFASAPILSPSWRGRAKWPLAVLNINSNKENLLCDNGETLFGPLLEPFLVLLSILILKRQAALQKLGKAIVSS